MSLSYLPLTDALYQYTLAHRSDAADPVLEALRLETKKLGDRAEMSISPDECSFLTLLASLTGAKWAVEVGTFTGSSSIAIARGLAPGGRLVCFDRDDQWTSIARRFWAEAGVGDRIELRLGDAREQLQAFVPPAPLDLVFIDADKENYDVYYELLLPSVRPGGVLVFDNMYQAGRVLDPAETRTAHATAIDRLNRKLATDARVQGMLLPIADGLFLCRKR